MKTFIIADFWKNPQGGDILFSILSIWLYSKSHVSLNETRDEIWRRSSHVLLYLFVWYLGRTDVAISALQRYFRGPKRPEN